MEVKKMVLSDRRHRLNPSEIEPVHTAIIQSLRAHLEQPFNFTEAETLYRILWRIENYHPGPPKYPTITWQRIREHINGPLDESDPHLVMGEQKTEAQRV